MKFIKFVFLVVISTVYIVAKSGSDNIPKWKVAIELKKSHEYGQFNDFQKVISISDGGYLAGGELLTKSSSKVQLLYVDKYGNKVWYKLFNIGDDGKIASLIETKDRGFIVATHQTSASDNRGIFLIKLNNKGQVIWKKRFNIKNSFFTTANRILKSGDGNFIIVGYGMLKESQGLYILKIDKEGNKLWDKFIERKEPITIKSVIKDEDDNLIMAGYIEGMDSEELGGFIIKIDKKANVVWEKYLNKSGRDVIFSMDRVNGGFNLVGRRVFDNSEEILYFPLVVRVNRDGEIIWRKVFKKSNINMVSSITSFENGDSIILGKGSDPKSDNIKIYLLKIDKDGNRVWEKGVYRCIDANTYLIRKSKDGGAIAVGSISSEDENSNGILIKIDRDGNSGKLRVINLNI